MEEDKILISLWKETRTTINHLDRMMDGVRVRVFTLFGTITSVAAALYYWAPGVFILGIRLPAFVELTSLLIVIPSIIQNRLYHYWLFKTINNALYLEGILRQELEKEGIKIEMLTQSLTGLEKRTESYWEAMRQSKLFKVEVIIYGFIIIACLVLFAVFLC